MEDARPRRRRLYVGSDVGPVRVGARRRLEGHAAVADPVEALRRRLAGRGRGREGPLLAAAAAVLAVPPSRVGAVPLVLLVVARLLLFVVMIRLAAAAVLLVPLSVSVLFWLALRRARRGSGFGFAG